MRPKPWPVSFSWASALKKSWPGQLRRPLDEAETLAGELFVGQRAEEKLAGAALPTSR
jgi:hypothetical protein